MYISEGRSNNSFCYTTSITSIALASISLPYYYDFMLMEKTGWFSIITHSFKAHLIRIHSIHKKQDSIKKYKFSNYYKFTIQTTPRW